MADPVIQDHFRAQVILHAKTGDPADVYTNSFVFRNDSPGSNVDSMANRVAGALEAFYTTALTGTTRLTAFLAGDCLGPFATVKVYDLGQPPPRFPIEREFELGTMGGNPLPEEVAACLSYAAGQNSPRHRGRIFLGPLTATAVNVANGRTFLSATFRSSVLKNAYRLIAANQHDVRWVLLSQMDALTRVITGAWMDDGFDTMRKRGPRAATRDTVGTYKGRWGTDLTPQL